MKLKMTLARARQVSICILAVIGMIWLVLFVWRITIAATDKQGFWWAYSCAKRPVKFEEVDRNRDGRIQSREAGLMCDTYLLKREISGRVCFEYLEPKAGVPLQTMCRDDAVSMPPGLFPESKKNP